MSAIPVLIGDREYPTKDAAGAAIREILYRYGIGETVSNSEDRDFLLDLIQLHSDPKRKIGNGIARFEVRQEKFTRCFYIVRTDGTMDNFSYLKCLKHASYEQLVRATMRRSIEDQVVAFRNAAFVEGVQVCPITQEVLAYGTVHVDHVDPTFLELANAFADVGGGYDRIELRSVDGGIGREFADINVRDIWNEFHRLHAQLRLVSYKARH